MNVKRANDVLRMIDESVSSFESESERLAILLAEARKNEYWRLRNFSSEQAWIRSTFPDKSVRAIRWLATIGQAFEGEPGLITEIGTAKAYEIRNLPNRRHWIKRARELSEKSLQQLVKRSFSRIKTIFQARKRIQLLQAKITRLQGIIGQTQSEIDALEAAWNGKTTEDCAGAVCEETRRVWAKEARAI